MGQTNFCIRLNQGVGCVNVIREFVMPDGSVKREGDLTPAERTRLAQKLMDRFLVPLAYEAVMEDLEKEAAI